MAKFIITVDSSCDYNIQELKENNVPVIFFKYSCDNTFYEDNMDENSYKDFYRKMKEGKVFKTSQINPQEYYDFFEKLLDQHLPIIHISLGSGVSNTINSCNIAISMLKDEYPTCDIRAVDSYLASSGLALLVLEGIKYRDANEDVETAYRKIMDLVPHLNTYYTTNTLTYFARGGRLSKVEAFIGNALKINPILDCNPAGALRVIEKPRGIINAHNHIIARIKQTAIDPKNSTFIMTNADNPVVAVQLAERIKRECGFKDYKLVNMGPIIGAHTGPGLLAMFYFGKERSEGIPKLVIGKEKNKKELDKELKKYS